MGRVTVSVLLENQFDLYEVTQGRLAPEGVRRVEIPNALVDTGAKMLSLPQRLINQLGLPFMQNREVLTTAGQREVATYGLVRLTLQGRDAPLDVAALPDECPVLIGYIPLEQLDFVVDPIQQRLIGDPFHKAENLIDMF